MDFSAYVSRLTIHDLRLTAHDLRFTILHSPCRPLSLSPCRPRLPVFSLVPVRENIVPRGVEEEDDLAGLDLDDVKLPVAVVVVLVR